MSLFINGRFVTQPLSGVQRFAGETSRALQQLDARYILLTPPGGAAFWPGAREAGARQGQAWEQLNLPRAAAGGLLLNLGNTGPIMASKQIVVIHDTGVFRTPEAYSRKFRLWYKFLQYQLIRRGADIITVSEFSRQEILRCLPVDAARVGVMPEGADHMHLIEPDQKILTEQGLEPMRFVLCVGSLAAHKNLAALGCLARQLHERGMPLVVAGNLSGSAFQTALLPQPAQYIGRVSDAQLKALYEAASCLVFPSRYEGFGLPPLEAMTCGCPVVASDIAVLREVCADAAQFCNPAYPDDIARKVIAVIGSASRREEMREAGFLRSRIFTWQRAAAVLDDFVKTSFETS
ncbi:MAG: glycosyltransferase family 4 protein [Rhodospirillales bacterium]|nr:glycosyltransferase family 4 protein [Rhodospirillales bacterium]